MPVYQSLYTFLGVLSCLVLLFHVVFGGFHSSLFVFFRVCDYSVLRYVVLRVPDSLSTFNASNSSIHSFLSRKIISQFSHPPFSRIKVYIHWKVRFLLFGFKQFFIVELSVFEVGCMAYIYWSNV